MIADGRDATVQLAGLDGCRSGWICVSNGANALNVQLFRSVDELRIASTDTSVLTIDIPIGLSADGPRSCDIEARRILGSRASCLFPAPVRSALEAADYSDACDRSFAACGKRLSKQAWAIVPRIRDMDTVLRAHPVFSSTVFEVHPELSFCVWNGGRPLEHAKKTGLGFVERLRLVVSHFGPVFAGLRGKVRSADAADDDLLDALAALWTAERISRGAATVMPGHQSTDEYGLRMQMFA